MSYDLYVELGGNSQQDVDALTQGNHRSISIADIATRIRLLAGIAASDGNVKDYVVSGDRNKGGGYKSLVHAKDPKQNVYAKRLIAEQWPTLRALGLLPPSVLLDPLPPGSWFLQFTFTLAKPWISKDDDPFYVAESVNPVRKDKVFKVPMMSAAAWKGLLHWTLMHTRLALKKESLTPERFARERFVQTLLFGDEKGEESGATKDFAAYLDALQPQARPEYESLLRAYYDLKADDPLPHHSGRLMFYPAFFDLIGVEVINPHSRKTKAGTHPIYLECVPVGAKGTFSLLYVPFDLIGQPEAKVKKQAAEDLQRVAEGVQGMFLTYGFSAKRTSGYGVAERTVIEGQLLMRFAEPAEPPSPPAATEAAQPLPKYLSAPGQLKPEYLNPDGTFRERSPEELAQMSKPQGQEYEKARKWWEREGEALAKQPAVEPEPPEPQPASKQWLKREFGSFEELVRRAEEVAALFQAGGEQ